MEPKSTHRVEVVPVSLEPHPDADSLSVCRVFGYTCCCRTEDWVGITKAAYLPPDSVVDVTRPEFAFLAAQSKDGRTSRVKAKRLRGVVSFGLLVPVPEDTPLGVDLAEQLGVTHYEPPIAAEKTPGPNMTGSEDEGGPGVHTAKYDLDAFRRYHHLFMPGEPVVVTEKLDGANARFVFHGGRMHCGSRTQWKREYPLPPKISVEDLVAKGVPEEKAADVVARAVGKPQKRNMWWEVMDRTPGLRTFCEAYPGHVVYGEIYGNVNCIKYGLPQDEFRAFDILTPDGSWMDPRRLLGTLFAYGIPAVPVLNTGVVHEDHGTFSGLVIHPIPYDFDVICGLAEGQTFVPGAKPGTIREGVVVSPFTERHDARLGRVKLKAVSGAYLERYR